MKRLITILVLCLAAPALLAQEKKEEEKKAPEYNTTREYKQKIFEVKHRSARAVFASVAQLGSGFKGSAINFNNDLGTITVRDFPENIASIEEAVRRLDQPAEAATEIDLKISVLVASNAEMPNASVPDDLEPVVRQLKSTLRYANYGLMATSVHRTTAGRTLRGSGVADVSAMSPKEARDTHGNFEYNLRDLAATITSQRSAVEIGEFFFTMRVPFATATGGVDYRSIGFTTAVTVRNGEKVVIGTTTMGDKALIVVVTATVLTPAAK